MRASLFRRAIAAACVVSIGFVLTAAPVLAAAPTQLDGRVFGQDGITPRDGVVVALYDATSEQTYRSAPSDTDGRFSIDSAPAGDYSLLAQAEQVAYLAESSLTLQEGANPPLSLSITQVAPAQSGDDGANELPTWAKGLVGGVVAVAALFVIKEILEDVEEDSSPF